MCGQNQTRFLIPIVVAVVANVFGCPLERLCAEEKTEEENKLVEQRLALMRDRIQQFAVTADATDTDFPERLESMPIFRYTDPARGYVAAGLWKLGAKGRPLAIISTELYPRFGNGGPRIVYEYLSLTDQPFAVISADFHWRPSKSAIAFQPIPDSPSPADTERLRLVQMRNEARKFSAHEMVGKDRCELRLLAQPINRYTPSSAARADGAIFIQAFGTNPEALLFIESDGTRWHFAFGRMSGASQIVAQLGEKVVWQVGSRRSGDAEYSASNAPAVIPGIGLDGNPRPLP